MKDIAAALQQTATGQEIDLTGSEALDHTEVASLISRAAGRTVQYRSLSEDQILEGARSHGVPEPMVAYLATLYSVVRAGHAAAIAPFPESLVGRKPITSGKSRNRRMAMEIPVDLASPHRRRLVCHSCHTLYDPLSSAASHRGNFGPLDTVPGPLDR